jgi:hypothetical protein
MNDMKAWMLGDRRRGEPGALRARRLDRRQNQRTEHHPARGTLLIPGLIVLLGSILGWVFPGAVPGTSIRRGFPV